MTMITPSYLGETIEYSSLHACRSTLEDPTHFAEYLAAVAALDRFAQERFGKRVIHLALRWVLDRAPNAIALWGARHPGQLDPVNDVLGWKIDAAAMKEIDRIVAQHVRTPLDPSLMAPPEQVAA